MTETEWLTSDDPQAMLLSLTGDDTHHAMPPHYEGHPAASDRKLRLIACACVRQVWHLLADQRSRDAVAVAERYADGLATDEELGVALTGAYYLTQGTSGDSPRRYAEYIASNVVFHDASQFFRTNYAQWPERAGIALAVQADILRDIVGNPSRPVTLPPGPDAPCRDCGGRGTVRLWPQTKGREKLRVSCGKCKRGKVPGPCPWLTHDVAALAHAAYDIRSVRACDGGFQEYGRCYEFQKYGAQWEKKVPHKGCGGTGRIEDGTLDSVRLSILADALEDAGCAGTREKRSAVGGNVCPKCGGSAPYRSGVHFDNERLCQVCWLSWEPGEWVDFEIDTPHPIIAHLRSAGPHWRGCWAVDLLRGGGQPSSD